MIEKAIIHIGFCFDKGYLPPFYVLLTSIFHHNGSHAIVIHAIAPEVPKHEKDRLTAYVEKKGCQILFYEISEKIFQGLDMPVSGYITIAAYYRLFFDKVVPFYVKKIIYIDIDTLIIGDLLPLYNTDIGVHPVAAVSDDWMPIRPDLGITREGEYFNSGVLLIDTVKWKERKVVESAVEAIRNNTKDFFRCHDQDVLNMIFAGNWYKLNVGCNLTGVHCPNTHERKALDKFLSDKTIIHFSGEKPWNFLTTCTHVYRYKWFEYYEIAPVQSIIKYFDVTFSRCFFKRLVHKILFDFYLNTPMLGKIKRAVMPNNAL